MLNRSASLAMSTSVLKALPEGKLDIIRHSPSILYITCSIPMDPKHSITKSLVYFIIFSAQNASDFFTSSKILINDHII